MNVSDSSISTSGSWVHFDTSQEGTSEETIQNLYNKALEEVNSLREKVADLEKAKRLVTFELARWKSEALTQIGDERARIILSTMPELVNADESFYQENLNSG